MTSFWIEGESNHQWCEQESLLEQPIRDYVPRGLDGRLIHGFAGWLTSWQTKISLFKNFKNL